MEDSLELLTQIREALGDAYDLHAARFMDEAREFLTQNGVALVIIDQELQGVGGVELFRQVRRLIPRVRIAVIADSGDIPSAVQVTKMGAADVFRKPLDPAHLRSAIARLITTEEDAGRDFTGVALPRWLTGCSPVIREFRQQWLQAIPLDKDLLVVGEPGTDRENVIQLTHRLGPARERQFVRMDVRPFQKETTEAHFWAALRELLQEPEFPAVSESHMCGMLVLSGLEDIPTHFQESIFQFLQGRFQSRQSWQVNAGTRVVVELKEPQKITSWEKHGWTSGFIRLNCPALSEMKEDLLWIVAGLVTELALKLGQPESTLEPSLLEFLAQKPTRGNVQELSNLLERAEWWSTRESLGLRDIPVSIPDWMEAEVELYFDRRAWNFGAALEKFERRFLRMVYQKLSGDLDRISLFLDIPKSQLQERLEQLGITSK